MMQKLRMFIVTKDDSPFVALLSEGGCNNCGYPCVLRYNSNRFVYHVYMSPEDEKPVNADAQTSETPIAEASVAPANFQDQVLRHLGQLLFFPRTAQQGGEKDGKVREADDPLQPSQE